MFENEQTKSQGYQLDGDDYDAPENRCGFFLGDPLREIFESVEIMLMRMDDRAKRELFIKVQWRARVCLLTHAHRWTSTRIEST